MFIIFFICLILLNTIPANGATYYLRADGRAKNMSSASSCSSNYTAMSVAVHNKQSFSPGDVICLCDDGGEFKDSIIAPTSGTKGKPITYKNADGKKPVVDLSVDVGGQSDWSLVGNGVYRKKGYGRVFWEDDVPLKAASSPSCSDGNWFYPNGSMQLYYKPTSGTPVNHSIRTLWFEAGWAPNGLDLRNRSHITVQGLNFRRCGAGIGHGQNLSKPISPITNIVLLNNTFLRCFWAIWSEIKTGTESDVTIRDNFIDYCNSGISAWTGSDSTPGHSQHHLRYSITDNKIMHLYSITDHKVWSDALLSGHYYTDHEGISFQDIKDSVISNNVISATFDKEFTSDAYWTRAVYFYLTNGMTPTSGNVVQRNYIYGHYYPAIYISTAKGHAGFENNTIAYNVLQYEGSYKMSHVSFGTNFATNNILAGKNYFVNNTIYNPNFGVAFYVLNRMDGQWVVRNNIFDSRSNIVLNVESDTGNHTIDHNIYSRAEGFSDGGKGMSFNTWRSKYDRVGTNVADPRFVLPGKDFHLKSGSPAIGSGESIGLREDFAGKPVHNPPSIGAYEYLKNTAP
jgi:hypothetical protein